jgi:hypothetical protein
MSHTVAQLVAQVQRHLHGLSGRRLNKANAPLDADTTSFVLEFEPGEIHSGSFIAIDDEYCYVWEAHPNKQVVVERGQLGTEAVAHAVPIIEATNRFPKPAIKQALLEELRAWPDGMYKPRSKMLAIVGDQAVIPTGVPEYRMAMPLAVDRSPDSTMGDRWTPLEFRLDRHLPSPNQTQLTVYDRSCIGHDVRFIYGERFDPEETGDDVDVIDDWGLLPSMLDIAALGAAARLVLGREIQRTDSDNATESRVDSAVPPMHQLQVANGLRAAADRRISAEISRLQGLYTRGR